MSDAVDKGLFACPSAETNVAFPSETLSKRASLKKLPIAYPQWRFTPIGNTRGTLVPAGFDDPDGTFLFFAGAIPGTADLVDMTDD